LQARLQRAALAENATRISWLRRGFFGQIMLMRPAMALGLMLAGAGVAAAIVKVGPAIWAPMPAPSVTVHVPKAKPRVQPMEEAPAVVEAGGETREALRAEITLIGNARRALTAGAIDEAARLLSNHAVGYPAGVLVQEREGLAVMVLWHQGKRVEAEQAALRFAQHHPQSPMNRPIRELLNNSH
jgi:TolA-binding protein